MREIRIRMNQERNDLVRDIWDQEEFQDISTASKLVMAVFRSYLKLKRKKLSIEERIKSLIT